VWSNTALTVLGCVGCGFMLVGYVKTMIARGKPIRLRIIPGLRIGVETRRDRT